MKRMLLVLGCGFAVVAHAATCCTYDGKWDTTPTASDDVIVIKSGNLTWGSSLPTTVASWTQEEGYTGTVTFDTGLETFTVTGDVDLKGGTWTHTANPSMKSTDPGWINGRGTKQLIVACGGDFTIRPGATIDVVAKGFLNAQGPGFGTGGYGASHGGSGYLRSGMCYGSPVMPETIGSGGRDGKGGGAVSLTVGGTLTVNGHINANSSAAGGGDYHSAGGSILLIANAMVGASNITASCGHYGPQTTSGAGGRIALKLTGNGDFSGLTGAIEVKARQGNVGNGACGTIYYETKAQAGGKGKLVLPGGGASLTNGRSSEINEGGPYDFEEIVVENYAALGVGPGILVKTKKLTGAGVYSDHSYPESLYQSKAKVELRGGELRLPAGEAFTNVYVRVLTDGSTLACGDNGDLTIGKNCVVGTLASTLNVAGDFTMLDGSVFEHAQNGATDQGYGVKLRVEGDMSVADSATITGTRRGFNGAGQGRTTGRGASHGGLVYGSPATAVYGSVKYPVTLGSDCQLSSRYAGGRVRVSVGGTLTMNGLVEVTGGCYNGGSASASGGSVWIDCAELEGHGLISAAGGTSSTVTSYAGGGGRIAVYLTKDNATFDAFDQAGGEITAMGGFSQQKTVRNAQPWGPCGSVYLSRTEDGVTNDVLVVANRNSDHRAGGMGFGPNVTDTEVGSVIFKTNGVLHVAQDGVLKVRKDFTRDLRRKDKFMADTGDADHAAGTVEFTDATQVSTVKGTNEFARILVATPGKTVKFGTADDASLTKTHELAVTGAEGDLVKLRSTTDGTYWPLDVQDAASVAFADVKDSDARAGLMISAKDSTDGGHNENWKFSSIVVGETIIWTGKIDSNWSNVANWDREREPVETDVIVIPAASATVTNMPALSAALTLNELKIAAGAELNLAGFYLTVTNVLDVCGSLVCTAAERIEANGPDVSFTNGTFTCANSTFVLSGGLDQAFRPNGQTFNLVRFAKNGGEATLDAGFDCYQLYAESAALVGYRFAAGKTVKATDCYVSGGTAEPMISFGSTQTAVRWNLNVTRQGRIRGVALKDCAATGLELHDDLPGTNEGNNDRWVFNGTTCSWTGAADNNFTNAANWADKQTPDHTSLVVFDSAATVTLTAPWTVRELQVESGTTTFEKGTNVLTVIESMSVEKDATLSLTTPCVVSNNVILRAGATMTHEAIKTEPGAITNRLVLTVGGDMTVESGASVNVQGKGFWGNCNGGFGYTGNSDWGPSHGGFGSYKSEKELDQVKPAYDSVFAPIHPGSNCSSGDAGNNGGGVAILTVSGTLTLNGSVNANGDNGNWYFGSGGSVWITARHFVGAGSVTANAGGPIVAAEKKAAGGRIAVCVTEGDFSEWTGTMTAYATETADNRRSGGAGTIYLETAEDGPKGGTLYITGRATEYNTAKRKDITTPLFSPGWDNSEDFKNVKVVVTGSESLSVPATMKIRDLELAQGKGGASYLPKVYPQGNDLYIGAIKHVKRWAVPSDTPYTNLVDTTSGGSLVWSKAMMIIIR